MSSAQYLRKVSIVVGTQGGKALDFQDFWVQFQIRRGDYQNPNSADVRIFNLSDQTANKIKNEFDYIALQAGYAGNYGLIFQGSIKQVRKGRLDQRDSYVDIAAADGDEAYNFAVISQSFAAGSTPADGAAALAQAMQQYGIARGFWGEFTKNGCIRPRVYYGSVRDELRDFAAANNLSWSIQDGKLTFIPLTQYIPADVPVISPSTGLIGVPEQTQEGISMRMLLNPQIKIGQLIRLDSLAVNQLRFGLDIASQGTNFKLAQSVKTNSDGLYYVMVANHSGDTRGNEWYTELTCLAADATVIPDSAVTKFTALPADAIPRF